MGFAEVGFRAITIPDVMMLGQCTEYLEPRDLFLGVDVDVVAVLANRWIEFK